MISSSFIISIFNRAAASHNKKGLLSNLCLLMSFMSLLSETESEHVSWHLLEEFAW